MDVKLKLKLKEITEAGILQWKKSNNPASETERHGTNSVPAGNNSESKALGLWLFRFVRKRLRKAGLLGKVQAALAQDALLLEMNRYADKVLPRPRRPRVDPRQSVFPGFEIPTKIGSGKDALILAEVPMSRFLVFVDKFRARSQRDQKRGEDLHRLAEKLRPFAGGDPSVADAFARANSQPVTLAVVPRLG